MGMTVVWDDVISSVSVKGTSDGTTTAAFPVSNLLDIRSTRYWQHTGLSGVGATVIIDCTLRSVLPYVSCFFVSLPRNGGINSYQYRVELIGPGPFTWFDTGFQTFDLSLSTSDERPFMAYIFRNSLGIVQTTTAATTARVSFKNVAGLGPGTIEVARIGLMKALDVQNAGMGIQSSVVDPNPLIIGPSGHIFHSSRPIPRKQSYNFLPVGAELFDVNGYGHDFLSFLIETGKSKEAAFFTERAPSYDQSIAASGTEAPLNTYGLITSDAGLTFVDNNGSLIAQTQLEATEIL